MARWMITVEYPKLDSGPGMETIAEFDGTREDAERMLADTARTHKSARRERRRLIYRYAGGDAYYVYVMGAVLTHEMVFRAAELVWNSDWEPRQ
ncbi:hypothetical protein G5C60_19055 [Streptomyces sp. HC44]|uniref:Uncharacterized protein n=1 Tax=Streptomyces scabichelini TaxID=2711217 RepID=A0A6G4V720_9ACTN|nr:hypothetical protein [Streptomyces scabichelini]NGO09640.1 hypothetical protein [Streptomyces scabichelini]